MHWGRCHDQCGAHSGSPQLLQQGTVQNLDWTEYKNGPRNELENGCNIYGHDQFAGVGMACNGSFACLFTGVLSLDTSRSYYMMVGLARFIRL